MTRVVSYLHFVVFAAEFRQNDISQSNTSGGCRQELVRRYRVRGLWGESDKALRSAGLVEKPTAIGRTFRLFLKGCARSSDASAPGAFPPSQSEGTLTVSRTQLTVAARFDGGWGATPVLALDDSKAPISQGPVAGRAFPNLSKQAAGTIVQ
jgi:hypothetical protein